MQALLLQVKADLDAHGAWSMLVGPLSGTPYKVYAAQASGAGIDIWVFLLASIPARFLRFAIVTTFCHYVSGYMVRAGIRFSPVMVLLFFWLLLYTFYFMVMRG